MDCAWQDGEKIFGKRKETKEKLENFLHELKNVASDFIPEGEKSFLQKWNRMMVSLRGHFNSLDELECIWDELKESQDKISTESVSRKAGIKSVGTQKDDLIHWHSLIVEADENGNEVLPELELIDAPQAECKEEAENKIAVVGDKYIPQETQEPATQEKPKKKTKKQKRRAVRRKTTPLPLKRVFPEDCSNTSEMARQSRRRQQIPAEPIDHAQEIYALLNEEDTYEDTDVVKKIKLKRYAKLPDE